MTGARWHAPALAVALAAAVVLALVYAARADARGRSVTAENVEAHRAAAYADLRKANSTLRFFRQNPRIVAHPRTRSIAKRVIRRAEGRRDHALGRVARARPPHYDEWLCIHGYEGAWNDDGAPYYGGLQMDLSFQRSYGGALLARKGTANNWTPLEQMWVAERAYASGRGFYPWPNTARYCHLI